VTTVCWLRLLKLDAILLAIVTLVCAATIIVVVVVRSGGIRRSGLMVGVVVGLRILLVVVVVGAGARSPACAVEGLTAGLATTASSEAGAEDKEKQEADYDNDEDNPSYPVAPCRVTAAFIAISVDVAPSHGVLESLVVVKNGGKV